MNCPSCLTKLVDGDLAGTLSRVEERQRFVLDRGYRKVGMAYCQAMEMEAKLLPETFRSQGIRISGVSCNPPSQAAQLEAEGVDLAIAFGLCLGHDILCTRAFSGDQTTLVVKDRVHRQALWVVSRKFVALTNAGMAPRLGH